MDKKEKDVFPFTKSYESDGVMGKENNKQKSSGAEKKKEDPMFFNITESSE